MRNVRKNKNKRRFYEYFKGSKRLYFVIIPHNSLYESSGARRKYSGGGTRTRRKDERSSGVT
jgi:hypothetical protein